jgi:hypothetical protein
MAERVFTIYLPEESACRACPVFQKGLSNVLREENAREANELHVSCDQRTFFIIASHHTETSGREVFRTEPQDVSATCARHIAIDY